MISNAAVERAFRDEFPLVQVESGDHRDSLGHLPWLTVHLPPRGPVTYLGRSRWHKLHRDWRLPYGQWVTADGREVLFNRRYVPIWQRHPGQAAEAIEPQHIDWQEQACSTTTRSSCRSDDDALSRPLNRSSTCSNVERASYYF